jgi:D-alanyl-D-alanine carboxypeptidase/D-alanyl-D-alanine-endopeptidase (penicillin-binding protein 4)
VSRWLRWLIPVLLVAGAVAGSLAAWRFEAATPDPPASTSVGTRALTPVLSVRRLPTILAAPIAARRLSADLDALMAFMPAGTCAVVRGPEVAYDHQGDLPVVPASTAKLLTATAAIEALGPTTRFRTAAMAGSAPTDGVVAGDLTVVGGGDPLLATADYAGRFKRQPQLFTDLDALAAAIEEAGVRRVEGSVVGDDSRYDRARYVAGWPARYIAQDSIGPLSALSVNDGFERYPRSLSDDEPLEPAADPPLYAAGLLTFLLEARGVDVGGPPRAGKAPAGAVEVGVLESPPLSEVVGQMLRESDNNTAELLLKELGRGGGEASTASGAAEVREVLGDDGLDLTDTTMVDGSGLSPDARTTCGLLVDLLTRPDTGERLRELLPVAGRSGTLTDRFKGTALEGVLRAKTGSLTSVTALAGVVADDDPELTFAFVVNVAPPARIPDGIAAAQQRLGEILAAWPRLADLEALGPVVEDG